MIKSLAFRRCLALLVLPVLAACSTYLDARAENALREALVRVVGPAEAYDVQVSGAGLDATRFDRVHVVGRRIARALTPVIDRLELELEGVVVDRPHKRLSAVGASRGELRVRAVDLAEFMRASGWIDDPRVVFSAPDRIVVSGMPRIAGIAVLGGEDAEFEGRLSARGSQLRLAVDRVRIGRASAPPLLRAIVEATINPLFDLAAQPLPARIDAVEANGDAIRIAASGSNLPPP